MKYVVFFLLLSIGALTSCDTGTDVEYVAEQSSVAALANTPGFGWITTFTDAYKPDATIIAEGKALGKDLTSIKVKIFVVPSCSCQGTQQYFPNTVKTLKELGIPDSNIVVYQMRNKDTKHDLSDKITLDKVPTFVFMKGSTLEKVTDPPVAQPDSGKIERIIIDKIKLF